MTLLHVPGGTVVSKQGDQVSKRPQLEGVAPRPAQCCNQRWMDPEEAASVWPSLGTRWTCDAEPVIPVSGALFTPGLWECLQTCCQSPSLSFSRGGYMSTLTDAHVRTFVRESPLISQSGAEEMLLFSSILKSKYR